MIRSTRVSIVLLQAFATSLWFAAGACSSSNDPSSPTTTTGAGGATTSGATTGGATTTTGAGGSDSTTTAGSTSTAGGATGATTTTGAGGAGGSTGTGGAGTGGSAGTATAGGDAGTLGTPLCSGLMTAAMKVPAKGGACTDTDPQFCYATCGPSSSGFKTETCNATAKTYTEASACVFPPGKDYSCYKIPATDDAACPTTPPTASTACTVAACIVCGKTTGYLDSQGAMKTGYCVCPAPGASGTSKWTCASSTAWPCPDGEGC